MSEKIRRWLVAHPNWALALVTFAALAPFLAKPFNIDDPLFIWAAKQIQLHPANPYGFNLNWYGAAEPMWRITENPPLACYFIALSAGIFGWSEIGLHFAFLLPAIAVVLGTYRLAKSFCSQPMLAALATLFTPIFLVSSTTVMCDVLMLTFWVWAVVFWVEGMEEKKNSRLILAAILIAAATMTKYYGTCLVPLLAAYSFIRARKPVSRTAWLLIPLAVLCAYEFWTRKLYGHALFYEASSYASFAKKTLGFSGIHSGLTALAFTGGGFAVVSFCVPLLWRTKIFAVLATGLAVVAAAIVFGGAHLKSHAEIPVGAQLFVGIQVVFWAVGGTFLLVSIALEVWQRRDAPAWLLTLWIFGTFTFAAFFNWTVNARSLLPMAPALGILLARQWERKISPNKTRWPRPLKICVVVGALLALLVVRADFQLAVAASDCANQVVTKNPPSSGKLWFQGHWGFQYYMEALGATALDVKHSPLAPGDTIAVPANNTSIFNLNPETVTLRETIKVPGPRWLTTWSAVAGGGFYAAAQGPLPFVIGKAPPEEVFIYSLKPLPPAQKP
jgi:4-amino-4-deoxy-L-arabinose transferase-like glycosyltransferase